MDDSDSCIDFTLQDYVDNLSQDSLNETIKEEVSLQWVRTNATKMINVFFKHKITVCFFSCRDWHPNLHMEDRAKMLIIY